jgi:hypothetical protein
MALLLSLKVKTIVALLLTISRRSVAYNLLAYGKKVL